MGRRGARCCGLCRGLEWLVKVGGRVGCGVWVPVALTRKRKVRVKNQKAMVVWCWMVCGRASIVLSTVKFEGYIALNRALHACESSRSLRRGAEVEDSCCRQLGSSSQVPRTDHATSSESSRLKMGRSSVYSQPPTNSFTLETCAQKLQFHTDNTPALSTSS